MRAILINPNTRTVEEVDCSGTLADIYRLTGTDTLTMLGVDRAHHMYLDDEGLMRAAPKFFMFGSYPQPLAGCAVILSHDGEGGEASATVSLSAIRGAVTWTRPDLRVAGFEEMPAREVDHPDLGRVTVLSRIPVFATGASDAASGTEPFGPREK